MVPKALVWPWATCLLFSLLCIRVATAQTALPPPWQNEDVGAVGLSGSAFYSGGVFTVQGSGADIWGTADAFQYVYQPSSGNVQIVARVTGITDTNTYAKAGVMLRQSLDPGAADVILDLCPTGNIEFMSRAGEDASTVYLAGTTQTPPTWLMLTLVGSTVTGSVSPDGVNWTQVGTTTLTLSSPFDVGLAVTSHDVTQLNTATFDNVAAMTPSSSTGGTSGSGTGGGGASTDPPTDPPAISLVAHAAASGGGSGTSATTSSLNTTGATLLVAMVVGEGTISITDSERNTWSQLTEQDAGALHSVLYYCVAPTIGSGHTITGNFSGGYGSIAVAAFSGTGTLDRNDGFGGVAPGNPTQPGSITPTNNGELLILGVGSGGGGVYLSGVNDSFSITDTNTNASTLEAGLAYVVQTTTAVINPSATLSTPPGEGTAIVAAFLAAAPSPTITGGSPASSTGGTSGSGTGGGGASTDPPTDPPAISLIAHAAASGGGSGTSATTSSLNTTGATLLVAMVVGEGTISITDSERNTWSQLTEQDAGALHSVLYYCVAPTIGSGHTITGNFSGGYGSIAVAAFSGTGTLDRNDGFGGVAPGNPTQPGSITPTNNGELLILGVGSGGGGVYLSGVNDSFSITDTNTNASTLEAGLAYVVQTTTAVINPSATLSTPPGEGTAIVAAFLAAAPSPTITGGSPASSTGGTSGSGTGGGGASTDPPTDPPAISLVAHAAASGGGSGTSATTSSLNTTGATLLVAMVVGEGTISITDSERNTWSQLTEQDAGALHSVLYYCVAPTIGSGHTITGNFSGGYGSIAVAAFSGTGTLDRNDGFGGVAPGNPTQPGSITPTNNGELLILGVGSGGGGVYLSGVNDSFSITDTNTNASTLEAGLAYVVQTTTAVINPSATLSTPPGEGTAIVAAFLAAAPSPTITGGSSTLQTLTVSTAAQLQAALDSAQPGDTILLQAGATFVGNFILPANTNSDTSYITLRSSAPDSALPPSGVQMDPSYLPELPVLQSPNSSPALATVAGAAHYQLQLLAFAANYQGQGDILDLGDGSSAQNTLVGVPYDLIVDRIYMVGDPTFGQKRAIGLNSASTTIMNSYITGIWASGQDSQAICGWNGPGPYTITNNYLEGAGENVLFGGSDPSIPNLVPSNITFTGNYLTKPLAWMANSAITVKNLFELKNAQQVVVSGNIMEYNWDGAQAGYAVVFTPRNQDGTAPWSTVQQVQFTNNVVRHVSSGINILGTDNDNPSQELNDVTIENNLFLDINSTAYGGDGWFMLIQGGVNVTVDHNTAFENGTSFLYGATTAAQGFVFMNNIMQDNAYGIMGDNESPGNGTIRYYFPNSEFLDNVFVGSNPATYPTGNYYPASLGAVGFINLSDGLYGLAPTSLYWDAATDGTNVGANMSAIDAATGSSY